MLKRALVVIVGLFWAAFLFLVTFWLTFPGEDVAKQIEYRAGEASRGAYALDLGDVSPWWIGLSTDSMKVYQRTGRTGPADQLMVYSSDARLSASLFSLMRREPYVSGSITLGPEGAGGTMDYAIATSLGDKGNRLKVTDVDIEGESFPISELLVLVPNLDMEASGNIDAEIDLEAPDGLSSADGVIRITGQNLVFVNPVISGIGPLGRDVNIEEIDLELDADEGQAKIDRGRIVSDVANIDLSGEIRLTNDPGRSNAEIEVSLELDESMAMLSQMLKSAEKNGRYVYECNGPLNRLDRVCRPAGQVASRGRRPRTRPSGNSGVRRPTPGGGLTDEERAKRREELQERLKKRREEQRARRANGKGPRRPGERRPDEEDDEYLDEEPLPEDDEYLDDEFEDEFEDEPLEPLDDEPLDDEEFFDE